MVKHAGLSLKLLELLGTLTLRGMLKSSLASLSNNNTDACEPGLIKNQNSTAVD